MKTKFSCVCRSLPLLLVVLIFSGRADASPSFVNPSFEADVLTTPGLTPITAVTGWTVVGGNVSNPNYPYGVLNGGTSGPTPYGNQFIIMGGTGYGGGYAEQTLFDLIPGGVYEVGFSMASEISATIEGAPVPGAELRVTADLGSATDFTAPLDPVPSFASPWFDTWGDFTYNFTATSTSATIRFLDLGAATSQDVGLDNVSVTLIPEPTTFTLLGLGSLALVMARRRS